MSKFVPLCILLLTFSISLTQAFGWQWNGAKPHFEGDQEDGTIFPDIVAIVALKPFSGQIEFVCTGIRMNPHWVLTVAHGVNDLSVGELGIIEPIEGIADSDSVQLVEAILIPNAYHEGSPQADLALLKVQRNRSETEETDEALTIGEALSQSLILFGWNATPSNDSIEGSSLELNSIDIVQGLEGNEGIWKIVPSTINWHVGPGNSGAPLFSIGRTRGGRIVGMLVAAKTQQRTLRQTELQILHLDPWSESVDQILKGHIPSDFSLRTYSPVSSEPNLTTPGSPRKALVSGLLPFQPVLVSPEGARFSVPKESPHTLYPLQGPAQWTMMISPDHRLPARVPLYGRHFRFTAETPGLHRITIEASNSSEDHLELSIWSPEGMRLLGRSTASSDPSLEFQYDSEPVIVRIELVTQAPLDEQKLFRISISRDDCTTNSSTHP